MERANITSRLKRRLDIHGPGVTIGVIALVIALSGGAYAAAKGGLTSKQKKQVQSIAKAEAQKYANSNPGAPGTTGPQGAKGDPGPAGKDGAPGQDGENGKSVIVTPIPTGSPICNELGGAEVEEEEGSSSVEVCNGSIGQDAGFNYSFSSDTAETDPGAGNLKLNNAATESATLLQISETDSNQNPLEKVIRSWLTSAGSKGTLLVRKAGSPETFAEYSVRGGIACTAEQKTNNPEQCGITDEGEFESIRVTFIGGNGVFANGDPVTIAYFSSGSTNLPSGSVEMGSWAVVGAGAGETELRVPISFPIPLVAGLEATQVHYAGDADFGTFCKGGLAGPNPVAGSLCIYANANEGEFPNLGVKNTTLKGIFPAADPSGSGEKGTNRAGAVLVFTEPTGGPASGGGTWAVRAP